MNMVMDQYQVLLTDVIAAHGHDAGPQLTNVFETTEKVQRNQRRKSGDPYVTHSISVAALVLGHAESSLDDVLAGMAHDLVNEPDWRAIRECLPARIVNQVTVLAAVDENMAKQFLANPRTPGLANVMRLKVADRLHNARTWRWVDPVKVQHHAAQSVTYFVPVAQTLGLTSAARELKDLSYTELIKACPKPETSDPAGRWLSAAIRLTPRHDQARYHFEWLTDLNACSADERLVLSRGFVRAAIMMRLAA